MAAALIVASTTGHWQSSSETTRPPANIKRPAEVVARDTPEPTAILTLRAPAATLEPESAELLRQISDDCLPLRDRRAAGRQLGRLGSRAALEAARQQLSSAPPYVAAAIAEGLGECRDSQASAILKETIHHQDEVVARGAIRGLALTEEDSSVVTLSNLLFDSAEADSLRSEAALSLGEMTNAAALRALERAAAEIQDESLGEDVLQGFGKRPFAETKEFFTQYILSPNRAAEEKVPAIEALANSSGDAAPFLLELARSQEDELRSAAVFALSGLDTEENLSSSLNGLLQAEANSDIRAQLYHALKNQVPRDLSVLPFLQNETDLTARLAGFDFLASALHETELPDIVSWFNRIAVPALQNAALSSELNHEQRLAAVNTLQRAGTPAASDALLAISQASPDTILKAATVSTTQAQSSPTPLTGQATNITSLIR